MARCSNLPLTYLAFLLLTLINLTSSLPPPSPPLLSTVLLTSRPESLTVNPKAIPEDPYLITINRYIYLYFKNYSTPALGSPFSLVTFMRRLREKSDMEARSHGGGSGLLAHFDFSRQQGGYVINFVVDWERQEGREMMLTYDRLATIVATVDDWRTQWGRNTKVLGCDFTYEKAAQEGLPEQVVARGRWWASPATLRGGNGANVTLMGDEGVEEKPAVVETSRKRSSGD